jgi:histidine triad (HIT) family protein
MINSNGSDTVFDKILRRELPATIVYEDDHVLAFQEIAPKAPIHILVIPKQKFVNMSGAKDQDPIQLGYFLQGISRCATSLGLDNDGYRVTFNTGSAAGQTVYYVHAHITGGTKLPE